MKTKKLFFLALLVVLGTSAQAQTLSPQNNSPKAGLKGFLEVGWVAGENLYSEVPVSFIATVGYQFNHQLFVGIGSGENAFTNSGLYSIPLYGDVRVNFLNNSISPFFDVRTGYAIADIKGFYFSPSLGCRFGSSINTAFTISMGYELQKVKSATVLTNGYKSAETIGGFTVRFGFDF